MIPLLLYGGKRGDKSPSKVRSFETVFYSFRVFLPPQFPPQVELGSKGGVFPEQNLPCIGGLQPRAYKGRLFGASTPKTVFTAINTVFTEYLASDLLFYALIY